MIKIKQKGNFNHFERFCNKVLCRDYLNVLETYAEKGVKALKEATPIESGETANAWNYEILNDRYQTTLWFTNSEEDNGTPVVILLLYGHGTKNGGYVEGIDFVSPALEPVFRELADSMWKEITLL